MRSAFVVLILAIAAVAVLYFTGIIQVAPDVVNIQAGTVSVAATYTSFAIVAGWIIAVLVSVAGWVGSGFRNRFFLILLFLLAAGGAFLFYYYIYI